VRAPAPAAAVRLGPDPAGHAPQSYRRERYLDLVERTRELLPDAALTTDIIVGFPGETEEDFEQTLEVVDAVGFDQAFTFVYSPRPGTPAADLEPIPSEVTTPRYKRLEALTRAQSLAKHQGLVGREHELLVEGPSKTDPSRVSGRTRGNHLVHLPAGDAYAPGDIVVAEVVEASTNYAIAAAPVGIRRTPAGRATRAAMDAGLDWRPVDDAPTRMAPEGRTSLPLALG
jgi:tRNA-2-methylthio-N6-dimethylallyladenosine synthase